MRSLCGVLFVLSALLLSAQAQPKGAAAAKKSRAGGTARAVADSPIQFADVTKKAGLNFHLTCGTPQKLYIMDAMCGGIAFFDYDRDGWPDIFLLAGSTLEQLRAGTSPRSKLYHNNHNGTFTDVTEQLGLTHRGWGMGVAVGDYDGDGWPDLFLTYLDHAVLYHNEAGKRFVDVTAKAGVDNGGRWGTSAAWGDYDGDGKLDLYVANYVDLDLKNLPKFGSGPFCSYRGIPVSCGPRGLKGSRDRLYRNRGDGTFEDVSEKLNIDPDGFYGLGVMFVDVNRDGCPDIYVADDSSPSLLYQGDCQGGLTEIGIAAGVAYSTDGQEQAGMGIDAADYDRDGWLDIAKINFSDDTNNLFHNDGNGDFTDRNGPSGFGPVSLPFLGFGVRFADFDNDGWPDIFVANGHVNPQVEGKKFGVSYAERNFVFHNLKNGQFEEIGEKASPALRIRRVGRGVAVADFDHDGKLDVLVSNLDGEVLLLRNTSPTKNHWLNVQVEQGIGAWVEIEAGGLKQVDEVCANSSYLSSSEPNLHLGLGTATSVDRVIVRWPGGKTREVREAQVDQTLKVPK